MRDGIVVTSPVQTFIDVALEVDPGRQLVIGDAMVQARLLSADEHRRDRSEYHLRLNAAITVTNRHLGQSGDIGPGSAARLAS